MLSSSLRKSADAPDIVYLAAPVDPRTLHTDRRQPICGLSYIARRLGRDEMRVPHLIHYVRRLIRLSGFPVPFNPRPYRGEMLTGAAGVCLGARWYQVVVDSWFDGLVAPEDLKLIDASEEASAAELLDARAAALGAAR